MIAIPNMEKPKNCYACSFNDGIFCALIDNDTDARLSKTFGIVFGAMGIKAEDLEEIK